ncbi:hypothetical protein Btru_005279 [Bulinus truncatus]|nr:hypothetical protein Btru_005279 [Bulinus truncatus]
MLFPVVSSDWEIINDIDDKTEDTDKFLEAEEFIPVDQVAKNAAKGNKRTSATNGVSKSVEKVESQTQATETKKASEAAPANSHPVTGKPVSETKPEESESTAKVSEDNVDLKGEGFIPIEEKVKSPTRKLAQTSDSSEEVAAVADDGAAAGSKKSESLKVKGDDVHEVHGLNGVDIMSIACLDKTSWECLMFKEDYIAMKKDWNLSDQALAKLRVKRQSANDPTTTAATTQSNQNQKSTDIPVEGSGQELYTNTESIVPPVIIKQTSTFRLKNATQPVDDKEKRRIKVELEDELKRQLKNVTGFLNVTVTSINVKPDGQVEVLWEMLINGSDSGFLNGNITTILDKINGTLQNINGTRDPINVTGLDVEKGIDPENILQQFESILGDPCKDSPCSPGYSDCRPNEVDSESQFAITCTHNCALLEKVRLCDHGQCELASDFTAFCACPVNWEGEYCEVKISKKLDAGQITGVTLGAIAVTAGLLGCCFWFLACRKSDRDIAFTHYSDEEGSGRFSTPSSMLSNFIIARPDVSVTPIQVFQPANANSLGSEVSFGRRSSVGIQVSDFVTVDPDVIIAFFCFVP